MRNIDFLFFIPFLLITLSCKKEKNIKDEDMPQTYATYIHAKYSDNLLQDVNADSAQIYIYKSEEDYYLKKNEIIKDTLKNGRYKINLESNQDKDYWFKIVLRNLTNERSKIFTNRKGSIGVTTKKTCGNCGNNEISRSLNLYLEMPPVNLQLNVFDNGVPVNNAYVSIFFNEEDYVNNEWKDRYASSNGFAPYAWYSGFPESRYDSLRKMTDANGTVYFQQYEPRQYWFRIFKDQKSNNQTTFKTNGALPNELDVTTVIDVGIQ